MLEKVENTEVATVEQKDPIMWAISNGATPEQLEKLLDVKQRHDEMEAKKAFVAAMSKFRSSIGFIKRTKKGHNCTYAGLAETIKEIAPLLTENGLSHHWETRQENGSVTVTCYLTHIMGHSESSTLSSQPDDSGKKNSIQAIGSAVSYLERYTLFAICGLASTDQDDDGQASGTTFITGKQVNEINRLIDESGSDKSKFLGFMKAETVEDIIQSEYPRALAALNKKIKENSEAGNDHN